MKQEKEKKTGDRKTTGTDRLVYLLAGLLAAAALGVAVYGIRTRQGADPGAENGKTESQQEAGEEQDQDSLAIRSIIIGDTEGTVEAVTEEGETQWQIRVELPVDFPFEKTTLNLELAEGASLSDRSNCILADLGGRPVVNLTVEDACLAVENGIEIREYRFLIEVK